MKKSSNVLKISKYLLLFMVIQILLIGFLIANRILVDFEILPDNIFNDRVALYIITVFFIGFTSYIVFRDLHLMHLLSKQSDMQKEAFENIESLNRAMRTQRHDFLNHIQIVYSLVEMNEYDEVINYLNEVYGSIELLNSFIKTEDVAINALLRAKAFYAEKKGIDYKLNILSNLRGLNIPSWEICCCIGNLIDNAIFETGHYNGQKSITITIKESLLEFEFTVENLGETIPKEWFGKLFNPGFTTKKELGEGMGLYIVKQIVERYNGSVSLASIDGKTSFTLKLPKVLDIKNDISNA